MENKKSRKMNLKNKLKNNKWDGSSVFLVIFAIMFVAMVIRAFIIGGSAPQMLPNGQIVQQNRPIELSFSDVLRRAPDIQTMEIRGNDAKGTLRDGTKYNATITYDPELLSKISENGATITIDNSKTWVDYLGTWVPILMGLFFIWWIFRGLKGGAGGISRTLAQQNPTKITTGKTKTTFKDVAGIDSEKQELMEIVDFLKNKEKFKEVGARVPRGILLSGEPGTGKTLLARAIAGEANVPFFAASGSDFSGIIVGLGVAKIKEIFEIRRAYCLLMK